MNTSEKYRSFLEVEAKKAPLEKKRLDDGRSLLTWWDKTDRVMVEKGSSDIMDLIYFGEDPSKTVVIDQKVAKMLRERLHGLEEENLRLHSQLRRMKIIVYGLIAATLIAAFSALL
ncbi:MAG: hypothetical protein N3E47_01515 [Candidatus Bathyarchaeota archaeon]|nr:hypothetical protein [Candidatus Bathyarchaeota archaeon]